MPGMGQIYIGEGILREDFVPPNSTAGPLGPGIEVSSTGMFVGSGVAPDYVVVDVHTGSAPAHERLIFTGTMPLESLAICPPDGDIQPVFHFLS